MGKTELEIKCTQCGVWNKGRDHCKACNFPVSQNEIRKQEEIKDRLKPKADKKDELDKALEHLKHHRFLVVRIGYHIVYSTVWMFWVISSVFSMIVAFLSA